jgi:hypothetical protein
MPVTVIDQPAPLGIMAARLSAAGLAARYYQAHDGGYLVVRSTHGRRNAEMIIDGDGYTALHYRMGLALDPARVAEAVVAVLDIVNRVEPRSSHERADSVARYDDSTTDCVGEPGMPGPQDQVPGPEQPVREAARPDPRPPRETDVPREGRASADTLVERLERLPPNHPSSPFREDGSRKPLPPDLRNAGLPLPDETPTSDGSADLATASHDGPATDQERAQSDARDEPHVGSDGSWDWKGYHLTPDQSRVGDQAAARCRSAEGRDVDGNYGAQGLTPAMRRIEAQLDHGRLVDRTEEFALKSPDRFKEKLAHLIQAEPDKSAEELAADIHDGVRYTFLFDHEDYVAGIEGVTTALESADYELGVRKNTWENEEYKGVNTRWRDYSSGIKFEIQFHTPESWQVKQQTHDAYEKINNVRTPVAEKELLREYQRELSSKLMTPAACPTIKDYRKEGW